ncbi:helix-turn-helix domain-containing protein [Actinocorallia longicatena]|uniref:TetR/AcrR family transcriptional regulator n=1 Tax=Actinocorallia longicatena TaxID=111803 RepID=A0ABP6QJ75_9ACTN
MPRSARLSREEWAEAALAVLVEGGPGAVAVEPVAARLGASKSSFYWLFDNRRALLLAALECWERRQTEEIVPVLAEIADPGERLRFLVEAAFAATESGDLALRLLTEAEDEVVRPVVERVTARRLAVIAGSFEELGLPPAAARDRAAAAYSVYLGTAALARIGAAPTDRSGYVASVLAALMP